MPEDYKLTFIPVTPEDYERIYPYTSAYGEGSCQHSPVSMYAQCEKYGDSVCIRDGFLFTLRSGLCDAEKRVYLAPMGSGDRKEAWERVFRDAAQYGKKAAFRTLTEEAAGFLEKTFPGRFDIAEDRDMAEYFCRSASTATFAGGALQRRRREVHTFWHTFGERAKVSAMMPEDFQDVKRFEEKWLEDSVENHDGEALQIEARMIGRHLDHFDELHLSGAVLRIDGEVAGFSYGTKLNEKVYDALVEKVNRDIPHIAKVMRQESTRLCAMEFEFVNMEEDVGVPGLRTLKMAYAPEYMLRKFTAKER